MRSLGVAIAIAGIAGLSATHANAAVPRSGQEIYETACASCHDSDGRGRSRSQVGYDIKMLDLAVIREGGPARAFNAAMPEFGDALSHDEIVQVVDYARGFCKKPSWPRGDMNLPRPLVTEKAFPEDELVATSTVNTKGTGEVANKIIYEQRIGATTQIELIVPFKSAQQTDGAWVTGLGDVAFGAKQVLFHSLKMGTILSLAGEVILPTGKSNAGFSKGNTLFEPFLAFGQILPSNGFLHLQMGAEIPSNGGVIEGFGRLATGMTFAAGRYGRDFSPMLELIAYREMESGQPTHADLVPGMQVTLSRRKHIRAMAGAGIPLDDQSRPVQVMAYLLWDWFDGGLIEGW
jgi:cytochrome c553